jgi:Arylsulfotransferase (ASST)
MLRTLLLIFYIVASPGCGDNGGPVAVDACTAGFEFRVSKSQVSSKIPTVGVVEWSLAGKKPSQAKVVYTLKHPARAVLNKGGEAPVDLSQPNYRTLLLGLKQSADYRFHIEATRGGRTCVSETHSLPTTGSFETVPKVSLEITQAGKQEPGFIVTSSGTSVPSSAFILDADGDVVWYAPGPQNATRALMDYEGNNLWVLALNLTNQGGQMDFISMDGENEERNVPGLEMAHHDFTVMPGGRVAALVWSVEGIDPESNLVIRSPDGNLTSPFKIGSNLYKTERYHANSIHYLPVDDSFTIADRNPNLFVKVSAAGVPEWQLGGSCEEAPVGDKCVPQVWEVNHGHHLLEDGTFLLFNNSFTNQPHVFEFKLSAAPDAFSASLVKDYAGSLSSSNLGDVQRLPGGNTLVTYSAEGKIVELDADWNEVQTFSVRVGYTSWRPNLYGPPARL